MNTLPTVIIFLIQSFAKIYLCIIVLRFLLQLARADFYNPVSQFIVKATNPFLLPLRKVIPGLWGIDMASVFMAVVFHIMVLYLTALVLVTVGNVPFPTPIQAIIWSLLAVVSFTLWLYVLSMMIVAIASFLAPHSAHPILMLLRQIIEPVVHPFRRLIPPTGGIDLSFMVASIVLFAIIMLISGIAYEIRANVSIMLSS